MLQTMRSLMVALYRSETSRNLLVHVVLDVVFNPRVEFVSVRDGRHDRASILDFHFLKSFFDGFRPERKDFLVSGILMHFPEASHETGPCEADHQNFKRALRFRGPRIIDSITVDESVSTRSHSVLVARSCGHGHIFGVLVCALSLDHVGKGERPVRRVGGMHPVGQRVLVEIFLVRE